MEPATQSDANHTRGGLQSRRPQRFQTLAWRILLWMLIVGLGPLLIMAGQGYHCARQAIMESERARLQAVLNSRQSRLESWLVQIRADFHFLEVSPCMRGLCGAHAAEAEPSLCAELCNLRFPAVRLQATLRLPEPPRLSASRGRYLTPCDLSSSSCYKAARQQIGVAPPNLLACGGKAVQNKP